MNEYGKIEVFNVQQGSRIRELEEDIRAALKTIHLLAAEVTALRLELAAARRAA